MLLHDLENLVYVSILPHVKDAFTYFDRFCDNLEALCEYSVIETVKFYVTSGPTPSPGHDQRRNDCDLSDDSPARTTILCEGIIIRK